MLYRMLYDHALARLDPERVHVATARALALPGTDRAIRALTASPPPEIAIDAFGLRFPSPLGVAAGLDKNVEWFGALGALGFGYVEVGTITAEPQPGNPRPRIHRLPVDRALINSMGFPNAGADAAADRLRRRRRPQSGATAGGPIVAVNLGRTKTATDARADYRRSIQRLAPHADLLVLNVSSPNTPGLRDLQTVDALTALVADVRAELTELGVHPPLLVKLAPDLDDDAVDLLADTARRLTLDGLVCTNTTISRANLRSPSALTERTGGVSGAPLAARSLAVLRRVRAVVGDELTLVSVGGIETADDVLARIRAGATLVQAYTGFVLGGPAWPREINRGLATRLDALGARTLADLVGTEPR